MSFRNCRSLCFEYTRFIFNFSNKFVNGKPINSNCYGVFSQGSFKWYSSENNSALSIRKSNQAVGQDADLTLNDVELLKETAFQSSSLSNEIQLEDVSDYTPAVKPSFNFAAYVNKSPTLQELVKLNVNLYKLEKHKESAEFLLKLDFEKDIKQYITFLFDNGVPANKLGHFITSNPFIFQEGVDNLQIRINYMLSKRFTNDMIARIIIENPKWLSCTTKFIDSRLGHFQFEFKLQGNEVRYLAVKQPRLITYNMSHIKSNTYGFKGEMGFSIQEMKTILLDKPRLFMNCKNDLVERFSYVHNIMKISHDLIVKQPEVLTCRLFRIKQRHLFLQSLGRDVYDPKLPHYVSLKALVTGSDSEFCRDVAKTTVSTFNMFQKMA